MKKYYFLFLVLGFISINLYSQTASSTLSFEERTHDFGKIEEKDGRVSHTFNFKNTGSQPVVINNIVTGCGCVSNEYSKEPIQPGATGKIVISYNPAYRPGNFSREITIFSNNGDYVNWVTIKGEVIPFEHPVEEDYPYAFGDGLYLSLKTLAFGRIPVGATNEIELRYANDTNKPMTLKFVIDGNYPNISFINPALLKSKERGKVIVRYTMPESNNKEISVNIYPVVNGKKLQQPLTLKVTGSK
ncbi:hypothetical protein GGR21_004227 [Dysgonomonas hofstadii]|uniref:DUF1573 domain-containing protein n=1 Tax=Dysgonomonas hofstadii TaxID=637886 RepID=A0A840D041_9BACT|nr:DUF1573 domain-containing protein [Dysgonomonas hofstadii]MBB4038295.1 hypothetical protein [Dysgonomonas hofstadii]